MKPSDQIGRARNARINQAVGHAEALLAILRGLQGARKDQHIDNKDGWFDARTELETLTQCVHEANAYNNSLLPGAAEAKPRGPTVTTPDFESENPGSSPGAAASPT